MARQAWRNSSISQVSYPCAVLGRVGRIGSVPFVGWELGPFRHGQNPPPFGVGDQERGRGKGWESGTLGGGSFPPSCITHYGQREEIRLIRGTEEHCGSSYSSNLGSKRSGRRSHKSRWISSNPDCSDRASISPLTITRSLTPSSRRNRSKTSIYTEPADTFSLNKS